MQRCLYQSKIDRMLTGVSGGMAEYFDADPVLVRMLWVLAAIFTGGIAVILYFVMAIVTPSLPLAPPTDDAGAQPQTEQMEPGTVAAVSSAGAESEESAETAASTAESDGGSEGAESVHGPGPGVIGPGAGSPQAQPYRHGRPPDTRRESQRALAPFLASPWSWWARSRCLTRSVCSPGSTRGNYGPSS